MNTTPNPSATKKSSGELVGPLELLLWCVVVACGAAELVVVGDGMVAYQTDRSDAGSICDDRRSAKRPGLKQADG